MRQKVRAGNLVICYRKKQTDISFSCFCPAIDNEFRRIIRVFSSDGQYLNIIVKKLNFHSTKLALWLVDSS